jgi:hypothetical protein
MKHIKTFTVLAAVACCLASTSQATLLPPGSTTPVNTQSSGPAPSTSLVANFSDGGLVGTVTSWVVPNDPANPFDTTHLIGDLTFYYQVAMSSSASAASERFTASGFAGMSLDVQTFNGTPWGNGSLAGGVAPTDATRSGNPDGGNVVGFDYSGNNEVAAGNNTEILVVNTAWTTYETQAGSVIDGHSANVSILAPVPEPTTMVAGALLLLPFGASTLRILRRKQTA